MAPEERWDPKQAFDTHGAAWQHAEEACELFDAVGSGINVSDIPGRRDHSGIRRIGLDEFWRAPICSMPWWIWPRRQPDGLTPLGT